jgi:Zn-dependent M28 family amino/carboxypeptidase
VGLLPIRKRLRDINSVWPDNPSVRARHLQLEDNVQDQPLPVGVMSFDAADTLLGADASKLKATLDRAAAGEKVTHAPLSLDGRQARLSVDLSREPVVVHNVIAMVEGADPALKQQVVVVGAHMDHDGVDAEGRIFNGADDNASGTAGVLEVAEAFTQAARSGSRPARTVVFALWNGEEKGDLGSEYYVRHPVPEGKLVANVNMDMIGRNEDVPDPKDDRFVGLTKTTAAENGNTVHLLGYSYSPGLAALVREENASIGLSIKEDLDVNRQNLIQRSDQWSFLQQRVPAIFLTTGLHPDYHTPQDDVGRINFDKLEKIAKLAYRVTWRLASDPDVPSYVDPHGRRSTR